MVGYNTNRFTATINITVPAFFQVIGSTSKPEQPHPASSGNKTVAFTWDTPSFPGTIIAGTFVETQASNLKIYFKPNHKELAQTYADTAAKELAFFSSIYGPISTANLSIVELPEDTVPAAWAPQVAAITSRAVSEKNKSGHTWMSDAC